LNKEYLPLTVTDLLAASSQCLEGAGYKRVETGQPSDSGYPGMRVFEDVYNVVAVVAYNTWKELYESWGNAQATLVELISGHFGQSDPKAWDGYLVLLTPSLLSASEQEQLVMIRYNTSRVRKLIAAGIELTVLGDVNRLLAPLLPLQIESVTQDKRSVLDLLPSILGSKGIPESAVTLLVDTYQDQKPLLEALHRLKEQK
jgi:hypothetical protein